MRRRVAALLTALLPSVAVAQTGTISGVVYDSVGQSFLVHATVQLVSADGSGRVGRSVLTDARGSYLIAGLPDGTYTLGFLHPVLDSLGVDPPIRQVVLHGGTLRADLAIPSAEQLRRTICRNGAASDSGAALVGIVRDASTRAPIVGATVSVEWLELSIGSGGTRTHLARLDATTASNGWFGVCNVPRSGTIALRATHNGDSTDLVDLTMSSERLARRDLYLGERSAHTVDIHGTTLRNPDGVPIAGAEVSMGGVAAHSNAEGVWTLEHVPLGTHELQIRALGYFQLHAAVDAVDSVAPIPIALTTLSAVLDTVKVQSTRFQQLRQREFDERHRMGLGKFITEEDVENRKPISVSELFRTVSGLTMYEPVGSIDRKIYMRGAFADQCNPAVYVDNHYMAQLSADEIDAIAFPDEIAGIEVYTSPMVPAQFDATFSSPELHGCGSIVIWTKAAPHPHSDLSFWKRLAGAGVIGVVILAGFIIH